MRDPLPYVTRFGQGATKSSTWEEDDITLPFFSANSRMIRMRDCPHEGGLACSYLLDSCYLLVTETLAQPKSVLIQDVGGNRRSGSDSETPIR